VVFANNNTPANDTYQEEWDIFETLGFDVVSQALREVNADGRRGCHSCTPEHAHQ